MHCHRFNHHINIFASILYLKSPFSPSCISHLMKASPGPRADCHNACWLLTTLRGASLPTEHPPLSFFFSHSLHSQHLLPAQEGPPGEALRLLTLFPSCFLSLISSLCVDTLVAPTHSLGGARETLCLPWPWYSTSIPCFEDISTTPAAFSSHLDPQSQQAVIHAVQEEKGWHESQHPALCCGQGIIFTLQSKCNSALGLIVGTQLIKSGYYLHVLARHQPSCLPIFPGAGSSLL